MDGAKGYVGEVEVAHLGVSRVLYEEPSDLQLLEPVDLQPPYRHQPNVHKGNFGHLGVVAGERRRELLFWRLWRLCDMERGS